MYIVTKLQFPSIGFPETLKQLYCFCHVCFWIIIAAFKGSFRWLVRHILSAIASNLRTDTAISSFF